jgi:hypothetical protein
MDIEIFTDEAQRASWMFDNAGRDTDAVLSDIGESVSHYIDTHGGDDKLPEELCGAVCAVVAAANLYAVSDEATDIETAMESFGRINEAAWHAMHAVEHGDAMASAVFQPESETETVGHVVQRLTEWVVSHLPESDPDAFLASLSL